jgi:predicted nucleotidyltransferase
MSIKERWKKFKPLPNDIEARIKQLSSFFEKQGIILAYLFGSLAKDGKGEDVDIALLPEAKIKGNIRQKLQRHLNTERIDLINLKLASPVSRFEVIRWGKIIYKKSDDLVNEFELSVLREYKDTQYLRNRQKAILQERNREWLLNKI